MQDFRRHKIASRIPGLNLSILHLDPNPAAKKGNEPILFLHGATFPSALAFGYRIDNYSWMDDLSQRGFDVYALDLLGYGESDRYPEMRIAAEHRAPLGVANEVVMDVNKAVDFIRSRTGVQKIHLIGHSWGATVVAKYSAEYGEKLDRIVLFAPFVQRPNDPDLTEAPTVSYQCMTPQQRIEQFRGGTPRPDIVVLESDVLKSWGQKWLATDSIAKKKDKNQVCYPAGWYSDLFDTYHGKAHYDPAKIRNSVLLVRGEWDTSPSSQDAERLFEGLVNAETKRYCVIGSSTHVAHLETGRFQLYDEVGSFLTGKKIWRPKIDFRIFEVSRVLVAL